METRCSRAWFLTITVLAVLAAPSISAADHPTLGSSMYRRVYSNEAPVRLASHHGRVHTYVRPSMHYEHAGHRRYSYAYGHSAYPTWHEYQVRYRPSAMHSYSPQFSLQYPYLTYPLPHQPQLSAYGYYQHNYRPWYASPFGAWPRQPDWGYGY